MRMRLVICDTTKRRTAMLFVYGGGVNCELQCTAASQSHNGSCRKRTINTRHRHKGQGCFPKCHPNLDMSNPLKSKVIALYKNLLYLGREYPQGAAYFREKLKAAFMKNKDVTDPEKIEKLVKRGDFVIKELAALYFLRKYRAIKKRYYDKDEK